MRGSGQSIAHHTVGIKSSTRCHMQRKSHKAAGFSLCSQTNEPLAQSYANMLLREAGRVLLLFNGLLICSNVFCVCGCRVGPGVVQHPERLLTLIWRLIPDNLITFDKAE